MHLIEPSFLGGVERLTKRFSAVAARLLHHKGCVVVIGSCLTASKSQRLVCGNVGRTISECEQDSWWIRRNHLSFLPLTIVVDYNGNSTLLASFTCGRCFFIASCHKKRKVALLLLVIMIVIGLMRGFMDNDSINAQTLTTTILPENLDHICFKKNL